MRTNAEGEEEPVQILPVVILASNERRGREFYEGDYNPEATAPPACWSNDGITPDPSIKQPKASKCAKCPLSVKGSKVSSNGTETVACREFRLIAVVPAHDLTFEPLRVKLPVTSDFDGRNKEAQAKGWYGFRNYIDLLRAKGYKDTRALSTKLRFDPGSEWPKLQFSPGKWLSPEALLEAKRISELEGIKELLAVTYTPQTEEDDDKTLPKSDEGDEDEAIVLTKPNGKGPKGTPAEANPRAPTTVVEPEDEEAVVVQAVKQKAVAEHTAKVEADKAAKANGAAKPAAQAAIATVDDDDEDALIAAAMARKKAKAAEAAKAAATPAKPAKVTTSKAPVPEDDDTPPTTKVAGKPKADAPATKPVTVSPAVAGVLGAWADDDE
jgi:hypothetical protein